MTDHTLYDVLGVEPTASDAEIKKAYRKLAKEYHPDRHGDADEQSREACAAHYQRVQEAWDTLGDPAKRAEYDATGKASTRVDPEQELKQILVPVLLQCMQIIDNNDRNPTRYDVVSNMKQQLKNMISVCEQNLEKAQKAEKVIAAAHGRFTVEGKTDNFFNAVLQGNVERIRGDIEKIKKDLDAMTKAMDLLKKTNYRMDTMPGSADTKAAVLGGGFMKALSWGKGDESPKSGD